MKTAIILLVLALSFLECEQFPARALSCLGCTSGDRDAYENLLENTKVTVEVRQDCGNIMAGKINDDGYIRRFIPAGTCKTGIPETRPRYSDFILVYIRLLETERVIPPSPGPSGRAFYLRYDENRNTYMILDAAQAHWFFTSPLGGCDMFVATHSNLPQKPLLIHGNRNEARGQTVADFERNFNLKQASTDRIIANNPGYVLRARLHSYRDGLAPYWRGYKETHQSVSVKAYNKPGRKFQYYTFFGLYNPGTASWAFKYKGSVDGKVSDLPLTGQ